MSAPGDEAAAIKALAVHCRAAGVHRVELRRGKWGLRLRFEPVPTPALVDVAPTAEPIVVMVRSPGVGVLRLHHPTTGRAIVEPGSDVREGATVALLQVGPVLRTVAAPADGRLGAALVAEGAIVGYDTPLFALT